jgi:hypothetical protein
MSYTLTITGQNHSWAGRPPLRVEYVTEEEAQAGLRDYVADQWNEAVGTDRPDDPDEMVDMYFSVTREVYEILEEDRPPRRKGSDRGSDVIRRGFHVVSAGRNAQDS